MPFQVSKADLTTDWDDLFAAEWAAWMHPPQAFWQLMFPILDSGPAAEASAIKSGSAIQFQATKADPHAQWIKVTDTDSGKIVAGALWKFYDSNPYRAPFDPFNATWFPEGELRDLCNSMYTQLRAWRPRTMATAHAFLNVLFTHPDHRNQGAAGLLVEWGTREADQKGLEAYVEGTYLGRKVYERYGFTVMHMADMDFEHPSPTPEWRRLVENLQANPCAIMWRPIGGSYVKGETVVPWEGAPRKV